MAEKKGFVAEFKEFISRGSVMDLAVGVIIGGAFTAIVTSLVNDIIMPIVGLILGGVDFKSLAFKFQDATIAYGNFLQAILNFILIALVIFCIIKAINKMKRAEEQAPEEAPATPEDIELLREIRDALKRD